MALRDAIALYQRQPRAPVNAYEWYRRDAHRSGTVWIGRLTIRAMKTGGTWYVDGADLERAIESHRQRLAEMTQATADLRAGVLRGRNHERVETDWGYYERRDPLHFRYDEYEAMRRRSEGWWYCNSCMVPITQELEQGMVVGGHCPQCGEVVGFAIE